MALQDLSSIVISSKVRLVRNLAKHPFPSKISKEQGLALTKKIVDAVMKFGDFKVYMTSALSRLDAMVMHEKHLISRELISSSDISAVMLGANETISVMVNETDHICEECTLRGLSLVDVYRQLLSVDEAICSKLDIAFDEGLGFLSSNIADLGTGMTASVTMFLPALTLSGTFESTLETVAPQGVCVSGVYGDETRGQGYLYRISNIRKLGKNEREILEEITNVAIAIAEAEKRARERIAATSYDDCLDLVMRAWGVLTNAHKISQTELMKYVGDLKLGMCLGLIAFKDGMILEKLEQASMPFSLQKSMGTELGELERDKHRAKSVGLTLKNMRIK